MLRYTYTALLFFLFVSYSFTTEGQVTANFTLSDTAGCTPKVVSFTNTSTGATSYTWNLGNGTTSTLTSVSGSYVTAGTYTITLTASNGISMSTHRATINIYALPTVLFSASDTTVCPGTTVNFTSTSIPGAPGPVTYDWNFGDGTTSTATAPSHAYLFPGDYNATLFLTNGKGCINSLSKDPYIHVFTPASIGFAALRTSLCFSPGIATFTNTSTGVGPLTYLWRFGDGTTSPLIAPTHHYTTRGLFGVTLLVTDHNGCTDSLSMPFYIGVGALVASYSPTPNACLNVPVTFTNTSTSHLFAGWDFGDGGTAFTENGVHTYTSTGTYSVRLVVFDGSCYDTIIHPVTVTSTTGNFTISPLRPCPLPTTLTYTASSVPPGSTVSWYSLDHGSLGSGLTVSGTFPRRTISVGLSIDTVGEIDSVTMIVTDAHGCQDTVGKRDTINNLNVDIAPAMVDTCTPVLAHFSLVINSLVYDPFGDYPFYVFGYPPPLFITYPYPFAISSYSWDFGDGSAPSTSPTPSHTYTVVGGVYTVSCDIVTSNGCADTIIRGNKVRVGAPPPTPSFTRTPSQICAGQSISFTSIVSGVFDTYEWTFGDGGTDKRALPVHTFTVPGIYTTYLKTEYNGCESLLSPPLHDTVDSPSVVMSDSFDCTPRNKITFKDLSLGDDSHLWQFGDGTTSTASNPIHSFPALSTYTVTLTTYNTASGCRDTGYMVMKLAQLNATLTASPPAFCRDVTGMFTAAVNVLIGDSSWVTKYKWFFAGISTDSITTTYTYDTVHHGFHLTGTDSTMLILTDNHGCFDTLRSGVLVAKPVDSFNFSPLLGCGPLPVHFADHSIATPGTSITSYYWSFGDGDTSTSFTPAITHVYSTEGTYIIKEIVTDNIGCSDTLVNPTYATVHRPIAAFAAGVPTICAQSSVSFINYSSGLISALWFFGDGDTSTAIAPTHVYTTSGIYSVKLVVTGTLGCTDTETINNYITVNPIPHSSFTLSDSFAVCSPLNVNFTNTSTGATHCLWTFGDGTSSSATSPSDVYITPGYYTVNLVSYNSFSCPDTAVAHVNLFGYTGAFTYSPTVGCPPLRVHFIGTFSRVTSAVWDFSDGTTTPPSLLDTISHTYTSLGAFVPKLILTDSFGCTSFSIGSDTIKVGNIIAGFTITPNPVCLGNVITFHDTSSGTSSPIVSWLWSIASGVTSTLSSPAYTYTASGTYPVTLTVRNAAGCTGTVTNNVVVNSVPPAITGPSAICIGAPITFSDLVTGGVWSSLSPAVSVGSSSGIVTGLSIGVATITYSLGSGCTVTKIVTVTPVSTTITGASALCAGAVITLTGAPLGGIWSSAGVATVGSSSGIVTGVSSGIDTVVYSAGGCPARKVITVNPLPSAITGTTLICIGATTTLNSTPAGGRWTSVSSGIASIGSASGVVLGAALGTTVISYTLPVTGCAITTTVTVHSPPGPVTGGSFVCIGGSITLSDVLTGGTWSSSDTTIATVGPLTGSVTGVSTGPVTITYNAGGCIAVKTVSVNALPDTIIGPTQVCVGSAIALADSSTGGVWSSSNTLVATIGTSTGIVTGAGFGTVVISYSLGGGCTVSMPITVDPLPAPITGVSHVCPGTTTALHDGTPGGVWSSSSSITALVSTSGVVTGLIGGVVTIDYTIPSGCAATYNVTVAAVPPITGAVNMCAFGDTITVSDADISGSYSSTSVTVTNLGGGLGKVRANAPGVATITYTLPSGCSATVTLTVNPLPGLIFGVMNVCLGSTTVLHDASPAGTWSASGSGVVTIGSSTGIVTGVSVGTDHVTYTLPITGCKADTLVSVYIFPLADTITGPSNVCVGQTITLVDTATGGIWTSGSTRATVSGGVVTGVSPGPDTISYSVTNVCGTATVTEPITIYPAVSAGVILGNDSVCVGSQITLTDASSGGVWSGSNTSASVSVSGIVTGNAQGIDTITYSVSNIACNSKTTHAVTVNPLPDAGSIAGISSLCIGDSTVLTETLGNGMWSQYDSITTLVPVTGGINVRSFMSGTDTVFYSVTNICGTAVAKHAIIINAATQAGIIQGLSAVCEGASIVLTDSVNGGVWTSSNITVAPVGSATGVVTGVHTGTDTITYTVSDACGTAAADKQITVKALPFAGAIAGNSSLCVGDSLTLRDSTAGGVWSIGGNDATIRGSVIVKGVSAGTDMLSYTVTNDCGAAIATQAININALPEGIVIARNDKVLSVDAGYASYQWMLNGKPIPGATNDTYTFSGVGSYSVIVSNSFGCSFTCPVLIISDCDVSDIQVYPNPAETVVNIQWCNQIDVRLSAIDGKLIKIIKNATQVDVSYLPNGIYTLSLFDATGKKLLTKRVTKLSK